MPAPVTSSSSAHIVSKPPTQKQRTPKKTRIVRRRGRAKGGIDSDDEFEREVGTDSESEDDDLSSLDSASDDSDTELASEDVLPNAPNHTQTPNTSESSDTVQKESKDPVNGIQPFFAPAGNWSEMVADETVNGPADLPVIEFSKFDGRAISQIDSSKGKKSAKKDRSAEPFQTTIKDLHVEGEQEPASSSVRTESPVSRRPPGQTARQAYQQRLEDDPSYVPKVGGFWGHDDRLMDKDLRSLSGWWRGRWQGRGRGRGFATRGRGRGSFNDSPQQGQPENLEDLLPVDRPWTHDGFEEMKRKEDHRRTAQATQRPSPSSPPTPAARGGRGSANRGPRASFTRGGYASSPSKLRNQALPPGRVWFAMKPELMWTKQHEAFLYFDSASPNRQGALFCVKLPGGKSQTIKAPWKSQPFFKRHIPQQSISSVLSSSDMDDKTHAAVVRLPRHESKPTPVMETLTTVEEVQIDDVFTVRSHLVSADSFFLHGSVKAQATVNISSPKEPNAVQATLPESTIRSQLEQLSVGPQSPDPARRAQTELAVLRKPPSGQSEAHTQPDSASSEQRPSLTPLQTVFTPPVTHPSPAYGSPYGYTAPLPPGIAMNQHGMPYELATGRPVYLQPPPMYNPRPLMPHMASGASYVPSHMRHPSVVSPDFLAQPPSHTPPMNGFIDPSTGAPLFSFPRQTSRIEIRAPTEDSGKNFTKSTIPPPSRLRSTATAFESSQSSEPVEHAFYPSLSTPVDMNALPSYETTGGSTMADVGPAVMTYPAYQHYYYPDAYGYSSYVDMSQVGPYELYPPVDHQPSQGTVYY